MCLILRNENKKPWNNSKVRWKIFEKFDSTLCSPYYIYYYYKNYWNVDKKTIYVGMNIDHNFGFHVCVTRKEARKMKKHSFASKIYVIKKVLVDDFIASGYNSNIQTQRDETWSKLKIID